MDFVASPNAPAAIGPYSQGVISHGVLYTSGQVSLDPKSGNIVEGDFSAQARRVFDNLAAVLTAAGTSFSNVLKATVYVTDLANFATLNSIYAEYFGSHKPARTTVQVSALPKGAMLEVDLVAVV